MLQRFLWERSGHWENYRENMYTTSRIDENEYAIKPMNCPGGMLLLKTASLTPTVICRCVRPKWAWSTGMR
jgi:threonyl-tRNA synthetase